MVTTDPRTWLATFMIVGPLEAHVPARLVHRGGRESIGHGTEPSCGDEPRRRGLPVEGRHGYRDRPGREPEQHPPDAGDGPYRVEEPGIVAARILHDGRPRPHVGEEHEARDEGVDERHLTVHLREEEPGQDDVADELEELAPGVTSHRPDGPTNGRTPD